MASCGYCPNKFLGDNRTPRAHAPTQAAPNTTATNATKKTGWPGVSFLRGSCRMAVARHNNSPKGHSEKAQKTPIPSSDMANPATGSPVFQPLLGTQIARPLSGQHQRPRHTGKLCNECRGNPPRIAKVMTRGNSLYWTAQKTNCAFPT